MEKARDVGDETAALFTELLFLVGCDFGEDLLPNRLSSLAMSLPAARSIVADCESRCLAGRAEEINLLREFRDPVLLA